MLHIKDLSFAYVPGVPVFEDVNFSVQEGEFIAIGGRNGAGKTTITRLIMGLEKPTRGHIFYKEQEITTWTPSERGKFIGYVFQQPDRQMFRNTVEDEIAFGPEQLGFSAEETKRIVDEVMDKTHLHNVTEAYPLNLRRGVKQRIAIASALAMQSRILILDEPTSGQDGKETEALLQILVNLQKEGIAIILITHNMDIISEYCSRVLVIGNKTLAFDGTPKTLFTTRDDVYTLGLSKPTSVVLSEALPNFPYCPTMKDFEKALLQK